MNECGGIVNGTVKDVGRGEVKVEYTWMGGKSETHWAPVIAPMAGKNAGAFFMPQKGDVVMVAFNQGNKNHPYILGYTWNDEDTAPATDPRERVIRSANGHAIRFLDSTPANGSKGALVIEDAHGNRITLSAGKITIKSKGMLELDAAQINLKVAGKRRIIQANANPI